MTPRRAPRSTKSARPAPFRARAVSALAAVLLSAPAAYAQSTEAAAVTPPSVLTHVDPMYPASALASRKHEDVVLTVTIDTDGHVTKVDVLESGGSDLDEAAILAARQWTFVPAMRGDKPVASRIRMPFHFAPPAPPPEIVAPAPTPEPELPSGPAVPQAATSAASGGAPAAAAVKTGTVKTEAAPAKADEAPVSVVDVFGRTTPPSVGASDFNLRVGALA